MRKYFLFLLLPFNTCFTALSQYTETRRTDSLRIDSLKRILPSLKDSSRVDYLNQISQQYYYSAYFFGFPGKNDSIYRYASMANSEATRLNYKYGIAFSLAHLASSESAKGNLSAAEAYIKQAITTGESINNSKALGWAYLMWGDIILKKRNPELRLEILKKSFQYFQKAGDEEGEAQVADALCGLYTGRGQYEEAVEYCERSIQLSKKNITPSKELSDFITITSLSNMAYLYAEAGDYETALDYLRQSRQYAKEHNLKENVLYSGMDAEMAGLFNKAGMYDSAFYYMRIVESQNSHNFFTMSLAAEIYFNAKQHDKALTLSRQCIDSLRKNNRQYWLMRMLLLNGKINVEKKNYKTASKAAREALSIAETRKVRQHILEGYELLSRVFHGLKKNDSAYVYLQKYVTLKDSILNRNFLWRLNNFKRAAEDLKKEARLGFLNRDNKIKQQQLKQESLLKWSLIAGMTALVLIGIFVFRNLNLKRKNEKLRLERDLEVQKLQSEQRQTELQRQAVELEMQALRAQMNPHFIFNCLSSINRFIFLNDNKTASDYLTRFSRLIRMVLIHSQKKLITLEDELEMLRLYLDMERLRFKNGFDYSITTTNTVDAGAIYIPPLLLQPFCENAVWHGLMHKEGKGHLHISISEENNTLYCTITDDGIGRQKATEYQSKSAEKEKSLGLKITTARLALLNREKNDTTFYNIEDVLDESGQVAGTKVVLKIHYKESIEEPV